MSKMPFSRTAIFVLVAFGILLFAATFLLHAFDNRPSSPYGGKAKANSYSTSAVGYAGLYRLLIDLDRPAGRSLGEARARVGRSGTLIILEPDMWRLTDEETDRLLLMPRVLLVLPKWSAWQDSSKPSWIAKADLVEVPDVDSTLDLFDTKAEIFRRPWPSTWQHNEIPIEPVGSGSVQLVTSAKLRPVVGGPDGMLIGEFTRGGFVTWVVSDPDVLNNHGLAKGDNAAFAVALIDALRMTGNDDPRGPIIFDEAVHGFKAAEGSFIKTMFQFPFVIVTCLMCLTVALFVWAGIGRFGAARRARMELDYGKKTLIDNSARLLDYAGYQAVTLKRYINMTVRSVSESLHAPAEISGDALYDWLDRIGQSRSVGRSCRDILAAANALDTNDPGNLTRLFDCARDIYLWKGEILNEPSTRR